jgi:Tfp pilus assembly protein PilF
MYRSDRNAGNRMSFSVTAGAVSLLVVVAACTGQDEVKSEKPASSTTPVVAPPVVATASMSTGEVVDSGGSASPVVTFAAAEAVYKRREYSEAAKSFDAYTRRHPDNAFGYYMLGLSAWKAGDLDRARVALERSLALDSTNVKTLLNLTRVLLDQGRAEAAIIHVRSAAVLDTTSGEVHRMLGRVQSTLGEHDSAEASYRMALSIDPRDSWSMNNLGLLLIDQGRYEEALEPLARAVALRPDAPAFANNLGVALERTGHSGSAAVAYRAALSADSSYVKAQRSLARVEGKTDEAPIDVQAVAARFDEKLQSASRARQMATGVVKPES